MAARATEARHCFRSIPAAVCSLSQTSRCRARASISAMSCGVETMTAPASGVLLRHGELRIAGTGRQIDDKNVETAPRHFAQHLRNGRDQPSARARSWRGLPHQEADRHHLTPSAPSARACAGPPGAVCRADRTVSAATDHRCRHRGCRLSDQWLQSQARDCMRWWICRRLPCRRRLR